MALSLAREQRSTEEAALIAQIQEATNLLWYDEPPQVVRERKSAMGDWCVWVCAPDHKRHLPLTARGDTKLEALTSLLARAKRELNDLRPLLAHRLGAIQQLLTPPRTPS